jgi:hypothetical protein
MKKGKPNKYIGFVVGYDFDGPIVHFILVVE